MKRKVLALSGGIGGAKLALGLYRQLAEDCLTVLANPGDDFEHLGLTICPDFDTVLYTLAGKVNTQTGWGRADESWNFMASLEAIGGEVWFQLGDLDLAVHVERSHRLAQGESLSSIARSFCRAFAVHADVLPVTDAPVRTRVITPDGILDFQDYFVRQRTAPVVTGFEFDGIDNAHISDMASQAIHVADLIVICPSNPYISIDPLLNVPGVISALQETTANVVAVSPIIGSEAVKGPTAKMMRELGVEPGAMAVAKHYCAVIDTFVIDHTDAQQKHAIESHTGVEVHVCNTLMESLEDRDKLAAEVLGL